jgi:hypothetical protein
MGPMVSVEATPAPEGWRCRVTLREGGSLNRYDVSVHHEDVERWASGEEGPPERLVERAFAFLLERERPEQILRSFRLADIQRYFPEFDREIRR